MKNVQRTDSTADRQSEHPYRDITKFKPLDKTKTTDKKKVLDTLNKTHIKHYLSRRNRNKTLIEIYQKAMEKNEKKSKLLETMRYNYLKGRITSRDYFEAIYLQIGEVDGNPLAENSQISMIDTVHFDEIRGFMPNMSNIDNQNVLHFLSIYCNT